MVEAGRGRFSEVHIKETSLDHALERLSEHDLDRMGLANALEAIVGAMPELFAVDGAGVLLLDDLQQLRYAASSDRGAQILEAVKETTGRGPCVSALIDDEVITVHDFVSDERWPDLTEVLVENGIRGVLGVPMHLAATPVGSLNVYHRDPRRWDRSDRAALLAFNQVAERLVANAVLAARSEALVEQLNRALEARINIDRAVGVLMATEDLDAADAFERIRRSARSARRPVRDVAAQVLVTRKAP
jgi:GAF domain-containing protein